MRQTEVTNKYRQSRLTTDTDPRTATTADTIGWPGEQQQTNANRAGLREHPQRHDLLAEVHSRPVAELDTPQHLSHLALYVGTDGQMRDQELAHIASLCHQAGIEPPASRADHVLLETASFRLRWEPHTEFSTYTFFSRQQDERPFQTTGLDALPDGWLATLPGELIVASHFSLTRHNAFSEQLAPTDYFDQRSLSGSRCAGGAATIWTDFKPHDDGFTRVLIVDHHLQPAQAGRLVQRLTEIETYRLMALFALPIVRQLRPEITHMENTLGDLTRQMMNVDTAQEEQQVLESLSSLSARVEQLIAQHNFRLGITEAYAALVQKRIDDLRERRVEGVSTVNEFVGRRLIPATDDCQTITARLNQLSGRVSRAANLLRSRVDLAIESQNRDLLESMNHRTRLQLRLQTTVEGLSVVILSYYTTGLIHRALKALESAGFHVPTTLVTGISIPFVIVLVGAASLVIHRWVDRADKATNESGHTANKQTSEDDLPGNDEHP